MSDRTSPAFSAKYFAHANVNTLDVERALTLYRDALQLASLSPIQPAIAADGAAFGMPHQQVQYRGDFLGDSRGLRGPAVDLLQWLQPPTSARPAGDSAWAPGFRSLGIAVADLAAARDALRSLGAPVIESGRQRGKTSQEILIAEDLDGVRLELSRREGGTRFEYVQVVCSDLERSTEFYRRVLHLDIDPAQPVAVDYADGSRRTGRFARAYLPGQREKFWLELTQFDSGVNPVALTGNTVGVYRIALRVLDIDEAHHDLRSHVPDVLPPSSIDIGSHVAQPSALFFPDPDGSILEYLVGVL